MSERSKFYNLFWKYSDCQDIFLIHKEELLERKELEITERSKKSYLVPRIVISNTLKRPSYQSLLENRLENRSIDINFSLEKTRDENINPVKVESFLDNKFGKAFKIISEKANSGAISQLRLLTEIIKAASSEESGIRFLKKYDLISDKIKSFEDLKNSVEDSLNSLLSPLLTPAKLPHLIHVFEQLSNYWENVNINSLLEADKLFVDILYDKENYKERLEILDLLYQSGGILGGYYKSYYECTNCNPGIFSGSISLNVMPSKLKLKCPNCSCELYYLAPYKLADFLMEDITSKDGLLHAAIVALLTDEQTAFNINSSYLADVEVDIEIMNANGVVTNVIETKMYKTNKTNDVILANLQGGLKSYLTSITKLQSVDRFKDATFHFITNINNDELLLELKNSFGTELRGKRLKIQNATSFLKYVDEEL